MSETLGDALLYLRTDDSAFTRGIDQAQAKAQMLGGTLDQASASSGELAAGLGEAGAAAAGASGQVDSYRVKIDATDKAHGRASASSMIMMHVVRGTVDQFASGAPITQIFAQHIAMLGEAAAMSNGSMGALGAFLSGGWGIAVMAAVTVLVTLIGKLHENHEAAKQAELGADALGQAQSVLGQMFDLTSGKLQHQNELLILNARLTAENLRSQAMAKSSSAYDTFVGAQQRSFGDVAFGSQSAEIGGFNTTAGATNAKALQNLLTDLGSGKITRDQAFARAKGMSFSGTKVSRQDFEQALHDSAWAHFANQMADEIDKSIDTGKLSAGVRNPGKADKGDKPKKDTGPSAEQIEARFNEERAGAMQQYNQAMESMATSADEQAEYELRNVELARLRTEDHINADKNFSAAQKQQLVDAVDEAAQAQRDKIEFQKKARLEQEAQALADQSYQAKKDALQVEFDLADTEAGRKAIALKILDADDAYLRSKLEAVTASQTATDAEKKNAQLALDALNATAGVRREGVERANETTVERYLRSLNKTPDQINEAIDKVKIDGLEKLGDDLTDVIMRTKSLGEAFHDVANQIISDLVRIALEQEIIKPLANMLFGGSGGGASGGGGFFGHLLGAIIGSVGGGGSSAFTGGLSAGASSGISLMSTPGFALGGSMRLGGIAGLDRNMLSLNGMPLARVTAGEVLSIGNAANDSGGFGDLNVIVNGARGNAEIEDMVRTGVQQGIKNYDRVVGDRVRDHVARRS